MTSQSRAWQDVREIEDMLALLSQAEERRKVIRAHAWHGKSMKAIYAESTLMKAELDTLGASLSACWERLYGAAQKEEER